MEEFGGSSLYDVLDVRADASADDIRRAYRSKAKTAHPDAGGDPAAFRAIQEAYETLTDPVRRSDYDDRLGIHSRTMAGASGGGSAWSGSVRSTRADETGFTGDVEFPTWLRQFTDAPWEGGPEHDGPAGPPPVRKALVEWWSPTRAVVTPVAAGALLIVGTEDAVVALDALAGQEIWRAGLASPPAGRPVVAGDTIVVWTLDGDLHGLDSRRDRLGVGRARLGDRCGEHHPHGAAVPLSPARHHRDGLRRDGEFSRGLGVRPRGVAEVVEPVDEFALGDRLPRAQLEGARPDAGLRPVAVAVQAVVEHARELDVEVREHPHGHEAQGVDGGEQPSEPPPASAGPRTGRSRSSGRRCHVR